MNTRSLHYFPITLTLLCAGMTLPVSTKADDEAIKQGLINASLKAIASDTPSAWEDLELLTGLDESKKILIQFGGSVISDVLRKNGNWPTNGPIRSKPEDVERAKTLEPRIAKVLGILAQTGGNQASWPDFLDEVSGTGPATLRVFLAKIQPNELSEFKEALRKACERAWLFPECVDLLLATSIAKEKVFNNGGGMFFDDPMVALLDHFIDADPGPTHPEYKGYSENCLKALKSLMSAGCPVSNGIQSAISKGYPRVLGELLKGKPLPSKATMIAWLISAKAENSKIPPETFTAIKQMLDAAAAPSPQLALPVEPRKPGELPRLRAYFLSSDSEHGNEIWTTDGTEEGTHLLIDLEPGASSAKIGSLVAVDHGVRFLASTVERSLRAYQCSDAGEITNSVMPEHQEVIASYISGTNIVMLIRSRVTGQTTMYQTDGSKEGTTAIPWKGSPENYDFRQIGARLFVRGAEPQLSTNSRASAWLSEIRASERKVIKHASWQYVEDFDNRSPKANLLKSFEPALNRIFFVGDLQLWSVSSESAAAPQLLREWIQARFSGQEGTVAATPKRLFFVGKQMKLDDARTSRVDLYGEELFASDGTPEGTRLVKDINPTMNRANPDSQSSSPQCLTAVEGTDRIVFAARVTEESNVRHLWVSDGTMKGTRALFEDDSPDRPQMPRDFVACSGKVFFTDPSGLWVTDGTTQGTRRIAVLGNVQYMTSIGGTVLFDATDGSKQGIWRSDGTAEGTAFVSPVRSLSVFASATFSPIH